MRPLYVFLIALNSFLASQLLDAHLLGDAAYSRVLDYVLSDGCTTDSDCRCIDDCLGVVTQR